jgi:hypothetical protein
MSRFPSGPPRRSEWVPSGCRSSSQRVEEKNWSQFASRGPNDFQLVLVTGALASPVTRIKRVSIRPPQSECRSLRAIPPPDDLGTTQAGRYRIDHSHAGFPQGSLTRRFSAYLVSYWLTNAIDRIVKETPHVKRRLHRQYQHCLTRPAAGIASPSSTDAIGRCKAAVGSSPRPSTDVGF